PIGVVTQKRVELLRQPVASDEAVELHPIVDRVRTDVPGMALPSESLTLKQRHETGEVLLERPRRAQRPALQCRDPANRDRKLVLVEIGRLVDEDGDDLLRAAERVLDLQTNPVVRDVDPPCTQFGIGETEPVLSDEREQHRRLVESLLEALSPRYA